MNRMKIDIWSDVRCPFCYIGKRKFERALADFKHRDNVDVIWHSFQLDPHLKTQPGLDAYNHLAKVKGLSYKEAVEMHERVIEIGREVDINFSFERLVVANSFNAHRLIQLANARGRAGAAEEALFSAHFVEGRNIDDVDVLLQIGSEISLAPDEVKAMLASGHYGEEVEQDETRARSIGIRGVPFFILADKYAISGAQAPEAFLQALETVWKESHSSTANV